jgi:hypothetical protein
MGLPELSLCRVPSGHVVIVMVQKQEILRNSSILLLYEGISIIF